MSSPDLTGTCHNNPTHKLSFTSEQRQCLTWPPAGTAAPPQQPNTDSLLLPNKDNTSPGHQPARRRPHNNPTHKLTCTSKQRQCLTLAPAGAAAPPQQPNTQTLFYFQAKTMPHLGTSRRGGHFSSSMPDLCSFPIKQMFTPESSPIKQTPDLCSSPMKQLLVLWSFLIKQVSDLCSFAIANVRPRVTLPSSEHLVFVHLP